MLQQLIHFCPCLEVFSATCLPIKEATKQCPGKFYESNSEECSKILSKVYKEIQGLDAYDILQPCYHGEDAKENNKTDSKLPFSFRMLGETDGPLPLRKRMFGRAWPLKAIVKKGRVPTWPELDSSSDAPPCIDVDVATIWLNNPEVRRAIHTVEESVVPNWSICTNRVNYTSDTDSVIPYHKNLTSKGYRALIYSGDHDMCVPYTGSEAWTRSVGYKIVDEWRSWSVDDQVAGYTQGYAHNLTFMTIKGAGHTVPEYKPKESLYFYKQFINGLPV